MEYLNHYRIYQLGTPSFKYLVVFILYLSLYFSTNVVVKYTAYLIERKICVPSRDDIENNCYIVPMPLQTSILTII